MWKLACCAVLILSMSAAAQEAPKLPHPPDASVTLADGYLYEAQKLDDGVWLFASPEPFHIQPYGNVVAVEQADGFVLFDSGGTPAGAARILDMLAVISPKPVKAVVISHWHGDHVNGLRTIRQRWPQARTIATAATRRTLFDPKVARFLPTGDAASDAAIRRNLDGAVDYLRHEAARTDLPEAVRAGYAKGARELEYYGQELRDGALLVPEEGFQDRLRLDDPLRPVELRFLGRANTDGDAVAWLPRQRIIVSGDIVVSPIPFAYGAWPGEWLEAIAKLKAFDFKILVPGHGDAMRDARYLDRLSALIAEGQTKVATLVKQDLSLDDVQKQVDLTQQAAIFSDGDPWRARLFDQYWRQPFIDSAVKQARGEPIIQGGG